MNPLYAASFAAGVLVGFEIFDRLHAWRERQRTRRIASIARSYIDSGHSFKGAWGRALFETQTSFGSHE